jgi:hypothetical protein
MNKNDGIRSCRRKVRSAQFPSFHRGAKAAAGQDLSDIRLTLQNGEMPAKDEQGDTGCL